MEDHSRYKQPSEHPQTEKNPSFVWLLTATMIYIFEQKMF